MRVRKNAAVTVHDVARRAGVSQPTVSLVLSGHPTARVAPATRERVRRAAEELGYRPNVVARGLQQRRSYAIGVVVPDLRNPFSIDVISGAERVAAEEDYAVLLCDARERTVEAHLDALQSRWIDGVIVEPSSTQASIGAQNLVLINEPSESTPAVLADMASAGQQAGRHLLQLGHMAIGFIGPASDLYRYRSMERAFVQTLREAGVTIRSDWFRRTPPSVQGGETAARAMCALRERPTAVFCANDLVAIGAIKGFVAAGCRVPADMSIVGCDDIETARLVHPELTTVNLPARELGARAARILLRGADKARDTRMRPLPVRLVVRGSTAQVSA